MRSTQKGGKEVLKFVACLRILVFLHNISIVHFCEWGWEGCYWSKKKICGRHNCMIPNAEKVMYFHNEKKTLNIFNLQQWQQNEQLQIFIQANVICRGKTESMSRTTTYA